MIYYFIIVLSLLESQFIFVDPEIEVIVNNSKPQKSSIIFAKRTDGIQLHSNIEGKWVWYKPVAYEYDNLKNGTNQIIPITYQIESVNKINSSSLTLKSLSAGTHLIGIVDQLIDTTITTTKPLHLSKENVIQIVIRQDDTYLGFLTELIGLPFIIPPMLVDNYGHQTDLRIGTDCAELAIYGMRRMGFNIPYCGPGKIYEYLDIDQELRSGTILHFGFQVSILFRDEGEIGILDEDDILLHAFENSVSLQRLGDTYLKSKECKFYKWKDF